MKWRTGPRSPGTGEGSRGKEPRRSPAEPSEGAPKEAPPGEAGRFPAELESMVAGRIAALARPLPHYGRMGYLVFDGARAVEHGNWPAGAGPLRVRLD